MAAAFAKGQHVVVTYGAVQIFNVVGHYGKGGRIHSRRHWRRGWYEVAIGWDVNTSTPILVTAHQSAIAVN
jgi:hypothetical protein